MLVNEVMDTLKLIVEYDGTRYAGWQRQRDQPTIQAAIEHALARITQSRITVTAAGRTDAGVHAIGQVVSTRVPKSLPTDVWLRALNSLLPADIAIRHVERVSESFHARYSAVSKVYQYKILNRPTRSALHRHRLWHLPGALDLDAIQEAARYFLGTQDCSSFQGSPTSNRNPLCTITRCEVTRAGAQLIVVCEADRFLKQMVRTMVGTLMEVGTGKRRPEEILQILAAKNRCAAGKTAPPHGLYLWKVTYRNTALYSGPDSDR
ncbi:MAG: tRNA pseudouridine(38-40) synthase TruA [Nitrospirae bacterium]|nr:MAG: tRNA pseudouridine(38-40) synthase TruA [Nitrospirota bacterium]